MTELNPTSLTASPRIAEKPSHVLIARWYGAHRSPAASRHNPVYAVMRRSWRIAQSLHKAQNITALTHLGTLKRPTQLGSPCPKTNNATDGCSSSAHSSSVKYLGLTLLHIFTRERAGSCAANNGSLRPSPERDVARELVEGIVICTTTGKLKRFDLATEYNRLGKAIALRFCQPVRICSILREVSKSVRSQQSQPCLTCLHRGRRATCCLGEMQGSRQWLRWSRCVATRA